MKEKLIYVLLVVIILLLGVLGYKLYTDKNEQENEIKTQLKENADGF